MVPPEKLHQKMRPTPPPLHLRPNAPGRQRNATSTPQHCGRCNVTPTRGFPSSLRHNSGGGIQRAPRRTPRPAQRVRDARNHAQGRRSARTHGNCKAERGLGKHLREPPPRWRRGGRRTRHPRRCAEPLGGLQVYDHEEPVECAELRAIQGEARAVHPALHEAVHQRLARVPCLVRSRSLAATALFTTHTPGPSSTPDRNTHGAIEMPAHTASQNDSDRGRAIQQESGRS